MTLHNKINGNRIDLIVCDGDRTLINFEESDFGSSWDLVGLLYYPKAEWMRHAREFVSLIRETPEKNMQEMIYADWVAHNMAMLKGKDATTALRAPIPYNAGVREYFAQDLGKSKKAILSGGIDTIFERARQELGMDYCITNRPEISPEGIFTGAVELEVTLHNKMKRLIELRNKTSTDFANMLAIGDSDNDITMLKFIRLAGGLSLAINPTRDEVANAANYVISDFTQINQYTETGRW